ncbi:penicillin-binding protein 2 [Candidatus Roizmanbacteria bacterium]|nr:penicillin-binding protein 2 [Candidatus Roizmanbacteria bacterium]
MKSRVLFTIFFFCFLAILAKLFFLQVLNANNFNAEYVRTQKILPERGKVLDRNGSPLALNETVYQLFAEPKKITDRFAVIKHIDDVLHIGETTLEARLDQTKQWVAIKSGVTKEEKQQLESIKLFGLGFDNQTKRFYPEASLSAHILGFVGKNAQGENTGYFGIEGYYNKELMGLPGFLKSERDLTDRPIFIGTQEKMPAENGRDILLTIDKAVQNIAKQKLKDAMISSQALEGCVIIANPQTMELLALTCLPDYDPSTYWDFEQTVFKNSSIQNLYEPGSTFKPLIVAAALEEGAIKPDEVFNETGPVSVGEYEIKTWDSKYSGMISITQILEKSSNVGMVFIGQKLGNDNVYSYVQKYGFGKETGIDLQGEVAGYLKPKEDWYPIDYATATFGQGVSVTPMQMIRAFSAVINGGYLLKPYTVYAMRDNDGEKKRDRQVVRRIITEKNSAIMRKMLVDTVENGEVKWAVPKGYKVGGKTGTAQIPIAGHYDATKTVASFIGFAPADNPKFIMLTVLREPKSSQWGAETAAPLFFEIARELFVYYNIPPSE